jgi:DNA-damage-inducible protein J
MAQTSVNIRMDEELKKKFEEFCNEIGMSMTTAICIFAKKAVREQKIPFEVSAEDPFYSTANIKRLEKAIAELNAGYGKSHELIEVESE